MKVWIVLRDWEEELDEYSTHHNDEFCGVFATEELANQLIEAQPNKNWESNNYRATEYEVRGEEDNG